MKPKEILFKPIPGTTLKKHVRVGGITGLFVFLILWVFQPFGTYEYTITFKSLFLFGYGLITSFSYILFWIVAYKLFPKWFSPDHWNIAKELISFLLVFCFMGFAAMLYHHQFVGNYTITFKAYLFFMQYVFLVGVFPFAILYYQKWITIKLAPSDKSESDKINPVHISFCSTNIKEQPVLIPENEILYLKAEGNYVEIISINNDSAQKHLIRNTLNNLSKQLPESGFCKVHRSYIANKKRIKSITVEGSKYELHFDLTKLSIPVSRSTAKEIRSWLNK